MRTSGAMSMDVTVLYFRGCPSWQTALEHVHEAAAQGGVEVRVTTRTVESDEDADWFNFTGSPTILLDGTDPFAQPGAVPGMACRLYSTPDGLAGAPAVGQLVDVLTRWAA
jgi:hypothetical protein